MYEQGIDRWHVNLHLFSRWSRHLAASAVCLLLLTPLGACRKAVPVPAPVRQSSWSWIDLEPDWRIRVVTPIQKSGSYIVKFSPGEGSPPKPAVTVREHSDRKLDITVTASRDLLGYEMSFYTVSAHHHGGVVIAFQSATATVDGVSSTRSQSIQPLFQLPSWARSVRLLHLLRGSPADHDAAILAGRDTRELDRLTALVQADSSACRRYRNSTCQWIPAGIAARPERRIISQGVEQWLPVR